MKQPIFNKDVFNLLVIVGYGMVIMVTLPFMIFGYILGFTINSIILFSRRLKYLLLKI